MLLPNCNFRAIPREGQHDKSVALQFDALATLNYSKMKRSSAADIEQYLRNTGVLCPCNDFLACYSEGMASEEIRETP